MASLPRRNTRTVDLNVTSRPANRKPVTADDVVRALIELCKRLRIEGPRFICESKSTDPDERSYGKFLSVEMGQLLAAWHQTPRYLDGQGNPRPLRMQGPISFAELTRRAVPGIEADTLLGALLRAGAVSLEKDQSIRAQMRSLCVYEDKKLAAEFTLSSLLGYIKTLEHNAVTAMSRRDQLFHRVAWSGHFDAQLLPVLKLKMKRQGQSFLESFDNWMIREARRRKKRGKQSTVEVSIGLYLAVDRQGRKRRNSTPAKISAFS